MSRTPGRSPPRPGSIGGSLILLAVLGAAAVTALAVGPRGPRRTEAVAFAAAVAGLGSIAGWLASRRTASTPAVALGAGLAATVLRLAPPLAGLAWLSAGGDGLRREGADAFLVVFYLALLATAIFLDIIGGRDGPGQPRPTPGPDGPPPPGV
jgi:hypothetical protein